MNYNVTVLIPTYKRAHLLKYALNALEKQTYSNFEVLVVLKPSGDGTELVINSFSQRGILNIRLVVQRNGYYRDAVNLGMKLAKGKIIAFLDDDAIPPTDWLQNHIDTYSSDIFGVSGDVIPVVLGKNGPENLEKVDSEVLYSYIPFLNQLGRQLWRRPVGGQEACLFYISKAGRPELNFGLVNQAKQGKIVDSILVRGTNISLRTETVKGFEFSDPSVLGVSCDKYLGWSLWRKGYRTVFNSNVKVCHVVHEETLSRGGLVGKSQKRKILSQIEDQLLFFSLLEKERELSWVTRLLWLVFSLCVSLKNKPSETKLTIKSALLSNIIGLRWILSKRIGSSYSPLKDLEKLT